MGSIKDNFDKDGEPLKGMALIERIRQESPSIALAFSYGKDSLATYLAVKDHFDRVVPFFRMAPPKLEFVERRLQRYEEMLGIQIIRVTHPSFFRMIRNCLWQPPHRVPMIDAFGIPADLDYVDINRMVFADAGLPDNTFIAVGVRAADSLQRRVTVKRRGAINWTERMFWPIWDWSHEKAAEELLRANVKLPTDYLFWGTSFDGLRHFFLKEIRDRYPEDYQTILKWFPFADMEFFRHDLKNQPYPYED